MKRQLIESLETRKDRMIAALWSNSNWDDDKGSRKDAIEEIEENFEEATEMILLGIGPQEEEVEIDEDNPFFAAAKRGVEKIQAPRNDEGSGTVEDVVKSQSEYTKFIDQ